MTPRDIITLHPEWADLDIVIYTDSGDYEYVGAQAGMYTDTDHDETPPNPVLVFSAN